MMSARGDLDRLKGVVGFPDFGGQAVNIGVPGREKGLRDNNEGGLGSACVERNFMGGILERFPVSAIEPGRAEPMRL